MKIKPIFIFAFILLSYTINAADRYWISSSSSNYNNTANWSTTSGGSGGSSVPGSSDIVYFDANGTGTCTLDVNATVSAVIMSAGTLNTSTYTFTISGSDNSTFSGGTINGNNTFNIQPTGTALVTFSGTTFNPDIDVVAPRILLNGSTFNGTSSFEKTGATDDRGSGGNTFVGNCTLKNTSTNYFALGNGGDDSFSADLDIINSGSDEFYLVYNNSTTTIGGDLSISNSGSATIIRISYNGASSLSVSGNCTVTANTTVNSNIYLGNNGSFTVNGTLDVTNGGTANSIIYIANSSSSSATIGGVSTITNNGAGTTKRIYLGNSGDITFNGTLNITNNSSASNSQISCNNTSSSSNTYNENIIVEVTDNDCDGIYFGNGGGSGTLAANKTITIGGAGYSAGYLYFRNFVQTGATAQTLVTTGTSTIYSYDSNWGGDIDFKAPRQNTRGTTYNGTAKLEKTGTGNDNCVGGNIYKGNAEFINSGSSYFRHGNGTTDDFQASLTVTNTGSNTISIARNSPGTTTIAGDLTINNISAATSGTISIANDSITTLVVQGNTTVTNSGAGSTKRVYLGNNGDITFNGTLNITNSSSATNSQIYCNYSSNSSNTYNENIIVEVTNSDCDGIYFGSNTGSGTLAATKTITIGGAGFSAGQLYFRNFTQTGATAQTLVTTGTSTIYSYDSNWGGNIDFKSPRQYTRGTTYNGTAKLEKTGAGRDASVGGNIFAANTNIINSGSNHFIMGDGTSDNFQANLVLNNIGSCNIYLGYNSAGNQITNDLTINNSGTSGNAYVYVNNNATSTTTIGGNCIINNDGSATNCNTYFNDDGSLTLTGNLTITNNTTNAGNVYISNTASASTTINGATEVTNSGSGATSRVYLGNSGDIVFNGILTIHNNSGSTNSYVYCNNNSDSHNDYNENIIVESTAASCDGVRFGAGQGDGILAASKTITIGAGGFVSGQLYFRNFTQTGATAHTLVTTGTSTIYSYDSNWGGDISFTSPRINTRGTTYSGTVDIEKTGSPNDALAGGNTFTGNFTLTNSGSGYIRFGDGSSDVFSADVTLNNTGSNDIEIARHGAGHSISGNLIINNTGTSTDVVIAGQSDATLSIGGNTTVINSGGGVNHTITLGNYGDISFSGTLEISNSSNASNSNIYLNRRAGSSNTYAENIIIENTNADSDGIRFGENEGTGILAANKTISINAGGFVAGRLSFRNFTQTGATPQSLIVSSTANMYNIDSDWGGDVIFKSPRMNVSGTTFHGTAYIEKTGADDDNSSGGNTFMGDVEFVNSGSGYLYFGSGSSSDFQANVTLTNSGSDDIRFARQGAGHTVAGDLSITNSGTGQIYIADNSSSSLTIGGATTVVNSGSGTNGRVFLGNDGDVTFNGDIDISNSSTATNSIVYIGNSTTDADIVMNGNLAIENTNIASDGVYFEAKSASLASGKTISIKAGGFISARLQIINLTQLGTTAQNIELGSDAYLRMIGNNWGAATTFKAPRIYTESSTYNGVAYLEKTGADDDNCYGGNTFKENTEIVNSGSSYLIMSGTNPDVFEKNLDITNSGSDEFYLANNASGVQIDGDLTIQNINNATAFYIANNTSSSVSVSGSTNISNTSAAANSSVYFGYNGDVTTTGNCTFTNNSSGTNAYFYVGYQENSTVNITGDVLVENKGANTNKDFYFGDNGDITVNGNLTLNNTSTADNTHIYCNNRANSSSTYNGNIVLSASNDNDGIYFGYREGVGTITAGNTLSIGAGAYSIGYLYLRNFTQSGATAQSLSLTGSAYLYLYTSNWGANVSFTAPTIQLRNSTFDGTASFNKTGSVSVNSYGGNTYNADVTIENSGSGFIHLANSNGNDYNSNATFVQSGSGVLGFAYRSTSTFGANLNLDYNAVAYLGSNYANSWIEFDGMAAQSLNNTGVLQSYLIYRLKMNNSADNLTLNIPIRIMNNADFTDGNIISTSTNYIRFDDNAVVDAVSDNSYVDGPVIKVGDDAFTFPVGGTDSYGNSHYAGIGISAPSATNHSWTADYHAAGHSSATTFSDPLKKVSLVEYWDLDRTIGSGDMDVTLYWGSGSRSGIGSIPDLRLAHWDGSTWEDKGNDASTGNATSGSITVNGVSSFSPFTFGTVKNDINPLPVSLISFNAAAEKDRVRLNWTTASEENNAYFIVERSSDMINIDEIQRVEGAGNSNVELNYQIYDNSPLTGISYYRLVQYDFDGSKESFNWKSVSFSKTSELSFIVYPNPSQTSDVSILFNNYEGNAIIEVLDISGRMIYKEEVYLEKNNTKFPLNINIESGVYFIRVLNGNNYSTKRLIIE